MDNSTSVFAASCVTVGGLVATTSEAEAMLLSRVTSMRVGGANYIRRLGLDDELLRMMGGWASLTSARGYFQLSAKEQFELANKWTLKERKPPRVEGERLASISAVMRVAVSG